MTREADIERVKTLNSQAWELKFKNIDYSISLSSEALALSGKIDWVQGKALALHQLGEFNRIKGNHEQAFKYYSSALELRIQLKDEEGINTTTGNIRLVYDSIGDHTQTLENYFKALTGDEKIGNLKGIARHFGNIANSYIQMNQSPEAMKYYFKAIDIIENKDYKDKSSLALQFGNLGIVYKEL